MSISYDPEQAAILLIDKPIGMSSNACLQKVKKILAVNKAGHTGSLDPLASGLLPICLNRATKFADYLLLEDKTYEVVARFGEKRTTGDAEGEIVAHYAWPAVSDEEMLTVLNSFLGEQQQTPPMFSALKVNGQPLYRLARKGKEIPRVARTIWVKEIHFISYHPPDLHFTVTVSKGTYIRTLVESIAERLGSGAYTSQLRRIGLGQWSHTMLPFDDLARWPEVSPSWHEVYLPLAAVFKDWPRIEIDEAMLMRARQGKPIEQNIWPYQRVSLWSQAEFLALGEWKADRWRFCWA